MLLRREIPAEPRLWFAWRPVWAGEAAGRPAGVVWLEQVVTEYIEGTWGGGSRWAYKRIPNVRRYDFSRVRRERATHPSGSPPAGHIMPRYDVGSASPAGPPRYAYEQRGEHPGPLAE